MALKSYREYIAENDRNDMDVNPFLQKQPEEIFGGTPGEHKEDLIHFFKELINKHGSKVKQVFTSALASGDFSEDIDFENDIKELIGRLPKMKRAMKTISKKKKIQSDPLNNVVSRTHSGPDGPSGDVGGGAGGGEG